MALPPQRWTIQIEVHPWMRVLIVGGDHQAQPFGVGVVEMQWTLIVLFPLVRTVSGQLPVWAGASMRQVCQRTAASLCWIDPC